MIEDLPAELILKIISYASIDPSYERFTLRSKLLRNLCLLSTNFRSVAQANLFQHPLIPSRIQLYSYLEQVKNRGGALEAKTLRIGGLKSYVGEKDKITSLDLRKLLHYSGKGLEQLYLQNVHDFSFVDLAIAGEGLVQLHMYECYFNDANRSFILPVLQRLSLIRCHRPSTSSTELITSKTAPVLRHVALDSVRTRIGLAIESREDDFIQSLLNQNTQLESLSLGWIDGNYVQWSNFRSLRLLSVESSYYIYDRSQSGALSQLLHRIPSQFECLMFSYAQSVAFTTFFSHFTSMQNIHTILYTTSGVGLGGQLSRIQLREIKLEAEILGNAIKAKVKWEPQLKPDQNWFSSFWEAVDKLEKGRYVKKHEGDSLSNFMFISLK